MEVRDLGRQLFLGSLYMSTWPFIAGDVGISAFSEVTCTVSFMSLQTFLAWRAMITLAIYNVACYALLFQPKVPVVMLCASGWINLAWNMIGLVFFPWGCNDERLAVYLPVSLLALIVLYAWCIPWRAFSFH
jgi:hypothetical protein